MVIVQFFKHTDISKFLCVVLDYLMERADRIQSVQLHGYGFKVSTRIQGVNLQGFGLRMWIHRDPGFECSRIRWRGAESCKTRGRLLPSLWTEGSLFSDSLQQNVYIRAPFPHTSRHTSHKQNWEKKRRQVKITQHFSTNIYLSLYESVPNRTKI